MTLSTYSTTSMEKIAAAKPTALRWLQINIFKDRDIVRNFIWRAEMLGFKALAVTVDKPVEGTGRFNEYGKFKIPPQYR